jgi:hypothetical protein
MADDNAQPGAAPMVAWVDSRLKDVSEHFEKRLFEDREFIKSVLGLAAKICGVSLVLIIGIIGFFGYKDIASIDDKINKSVSEKIKEKSDEFKLIYEKNIQGLADQASVTAYLLQFGAPPKDFVESPTILATHLQRFLQILSDEGSEQKITDAIYDLLSDSSRDGRSPLVDTRIRELVSGKDSYGWIKRSPGRLARAIDLLRTRDVFDQPAPALVRSYLLDDDSSSSVRKSAILYAEAAKDQAALPRLVKLLDDKNRVLETDLIFAVASLDPSNKWIAEWLATMRKKSLAGDVQETQDNMVMAVRVAASLITSAAKNNQRGLFNRTWDPHRLEFAVASIRSILDTNGRLTIRESMSKRPSDDSAIRISWGGAMGYVVPANGLFLGEGGSAVVTKLCRDAIVRGGLPEVLRFLKATSSTEDIFADVKYNLFGILTGGAVVDVTVDGKPTMISDASVQFSKMNDGAKEALRANWRTNDGLMKTGVVTAIRKSQEASFAFRLLKEE